MIKNTQTKLPPFKTLKILLSKIVLWNNYLFRFITALREQTKVMKTLVLLRNIGWFQRTMFERETSLTWSNTASRCDNCDFRNIFGFEVMWYYKFFCPRMHIGTIMYMHVSAVFILCPTSVWMWHKAIFKVGLVAGPKPNMTGSSKNASDPVGIPLFGVPQVPGDKPNPSEEG